MNHALTVVEEHAVSEQISKISERFSRAEDLYEALKWRLARKPHDGVPIAGTPYFLIKTSDPGDYTPGVPIIRAMYSVSENEINVYSVDLVETPAGDID